MARKVIGMARNVVGPTGGWRRRWGGLLALVIAVGAGVVFMRTVLAVHDTGAFELDGNALTSISDDWQDVFNNTDSAVVASFTNDGALNATIFTGGGSKDPIDINQWAWKTDEGGLPDKDNLLDSFAARYSLPPTPPGGNCPNGTGTDPITNPFDSSVPCVVLFFGSDRFDNSGDAQQGFWFFQNRITLGTNKVGGAQGFNGVHKNGDLLIISDFSNGGDVSTIKIFRWDDSCLATNKPDLDCADANLRTLQTSDAANCATVPSGDAFCGIVNPNTITLPWPFEDKSNTPNDQALNGEFFEGGVNLSLLGLAGECFSSVAAESRSSTSTTATLKDFVLGEFAVCDATISTAPSVGAGGVVLPGTSVTDIATVQGAGVANPPTPTGDVTFFLCGPIASGTCASGGTQVGNPVALADSSPPAGEATAISAAVNTAESPLAPGRYCFRAEWPGDINYTNGPYVHSGTDNSECFVVQDVTSATSAQDWLPNDSATITSAGGTALNGTLSFTLYSSANCTGTILIPAETFTLTNAASPVARSTTNSTFKVTASTTVSWGVVFSSSDPHVVGTTKCETTTLTINNNP
jgi:hypothetical protein